MPVEPQVFDLLVYLIEHRDRVVTRDELLDELWNGRVVSESALNGRLKVARKAVGDDGKQQRIIKTIHRRGYQFVTDVTISPNTVGLTKNVASPSQQILDKPSIVVLPLEFLDKGADKDYLADGLTAEIISSLCRYRELLVIAHESAFAWGADNDDLKSVAGDLGVGFVTKGNIRQSGDQIRVSVQLIDAVSGKTMWAERFDRQLENLFAFEDEIASKIALSLVNHIEDEVIQRAARKRPESLTAYDCVMRARQGADSVDQEENRAARKWLERAVEQDPGYAQAYALLALSYCTEAEAPWGLSATEAIDHANTYGLKAVALDDFDSEAHAGLGWVYRQQRKFDLAEIEFNRAIECNPNDYNAFCGKGWLLAVSGRVEEASSCVLTALHLNPLAPDNCLLATTLTEYLHGRYNDALETLTRIKEPNIDSEALKAACLAQLGRDPEAFRTASKALELGGEYVRNEDWINGWSFKSPQDLNHFLDGLYKSGVLRPPSDNAKKPSIAVIQFTNLAIDSEQEYFAEGMATNICSRLSRISALVVKSGFAYCLSNTTALEISRELRVDYLLGGTVQREGDHVRVFTELVDGSTGEIEWSEHFDRRGRDVIDIQDEIAGAITGTLWSTRGALREAERDKLSKKPTSDFNAFDYILKGIYYKEKYAAEELKLSLQCFNRAIELDPDSAEAYGWSAWVHLLEILLGSTVDVAESLKQAYTAARNAIKRDAYSEIGHWALAEAYLLDQDSVRAFVEFEKALEINPNNPDLMVSKGCELSILGKFDEGIALIDKGINFNKHFPQWYFWHLGIAYFTGQQLEDSIGAFIRMDNQNKDTLTFLVACYAHTGDLTEAETQLTQLLDFDPDISIEKIAKTHGYLAADTLDILISGVNLAMNSNQSMAQLHVVKS
ncbi:MAG: tetratricopeptide repeat protein [bacterium]